MRIEMFPRGRRNWLALYRDSANLAVQPTPIGNKRSEKKRAGRKQSFSIPYIFPGYEFATLNSN
ncbi:MULTISPECIES: hypothetical protein [Paraburkholderia]|uniref:Uncharacterized protein n=1 Tax=Paraburkholderia dioscoreae TaxID=2604047 RepID=A0A5Q4YYH8_9BURK|nr:MULTISPECIES: hypothetical protein [Paraburkholderia]MDR8398988.1 hypothetical protein [Paraburkholderia sp. USG1]VVD34034.1 protein of unknown function [Paraburkholderia dioscoreae]